MYFELREEQRYVTKCPECGDDRTKKNTKSLQVFRDPDGYIRYQCLHAGQCILNERKYMKDPSPLNVVDKSINQGEEQAHVGADTPSIIDGNQVWWYRDNEGNPLFGCLRYKDTKIFTPVLIRGDTYKYGKDTKWPSNKVLFNQENIPNHNTVIVVEGEKAATEGQKIFTKAAVVSWRGGANNISSGDWDLLRGKDVILWPDNDKPGIEIMEKIGQVIPNLNYKMAAVSHLPEKADLADNLSREDITRALREAKDLSKLDFGKMSFEDLVEQHEFLNHRLTIGLPEIDDNIKLPMSGYVVIEGRTKHGKSALGIYLSRSILDSGGRVIYFSYEIPAARVIARYVRAKNPEVPIEQVFSSPEIEPVRRYLKEGKLQVIDQKAQLNIDKLCTLLDSPDLNGTCVIIDYIQIIPMNGGDRQLVIKSAVDRLRVLANKHGFIIFLMSQLTPNLQQPQYDTPRECNDIHFAAEMVMRIWNRRKAGEHPLYRSCEGDMVLHIKENRDGDSDQLLGFDFTEGAKLDFLALSHIGDRASSEPREEISAKDVKDVVKTIKYLADAMMLRGDKI